MEPCTDDLAWDDHDVIVTRFVSFSKDVKGHQALLIVFKIVDSSEYPHCTTKSLLVVLNELGRFYGSVWALRTKITNRLSQ